VSTTLVDLACVKKMRDVHCLGICSGRISVQRKLGIPFNTMEEDEQEENNDDNESVEN
jgi:hypothetical protein